MRKFIVFGMLLFLCVAANSQVRNIKGQWGVHALGGISEPGYFLEAGATYNTGAKSEINADLMYEGGKPNQIKYSVYSLTSNFMYNFFDIKNVFYVNGGTGLTFNLNNQSYELTGQSIQKVDYGLLFTLEGEFFTSDKLAILLDFNQRYFISGNLGNWAYFTGAGVKYILN